MLRHSLLLRIIKPIKTVDKAISHIRSGSTLLVGGFGTSGCPHYLAQALSYRDVNNLQIYTNGSTLEGWCVGQFIGKKMVSRLGTSHLGVNALALNAYLQGQLDLELIPQGSFVERIRAGGAGIPAFFTRAGAGTNVEYGLFPSRLCPDAKPLEYSKPKEARVFDHNQYILENAITGDYALIKAWKADRAGNLIFRHTQANFNVAAAMAAKHRIVEVEHLLELGEIPPDEVHLPGIYVSEIVIAPKYKVPIETSFSTPDDQMKHKPTPPNLSNMSCKEKIRRRAALELQHGMAVNLGIGIPVGVTEFVDPNITIMIQAENGLLGGGPRPKESDADGELIDGGLKPVTLMPGGSTFPSHVSFGMIRGGHISLTMLGALEVGANGDLSNWLVPGKMVTGMGGAMDIVSSGTRVVVLMEHVNKAGKPKIVANCKYPLTSRRCVSRIITELAVFDVEITSRSKGGLTLVEIAPNATVDEVKECTDAVFKVSPKLTMMKYAGL